MTELRTIRGGLIFAALIGSGFALALDGTGAAAQQDGVRHGAGARRTHAGDRRHDGRRPLAGGHHPEPQGVDWTPITSASATPRTWLRR